MGGCRPDLFQRTNQAATSKAPATKAKTKQTAQVGISKNPYIGAIVVDANSGRVLVEENADGKGYPASVLKLMDLLIVIEKIKAGQMTLQDPVPVSAKAAKTGGSQVWLAEKEVFTLDEMLYALMIQSANDSAVAIAEKVAGYRSLRRAHEPKSQAIGHEQYKSQLGARFAAGRGTGSRRNHRPRFLDSFREVLKHPETLRYTSTRERPFRPGVAGKTVVMRTHNHLLGSLDGCDGLKTGYITVAGFSIAVTASRNGQRVIAMVLGSSDRKVRNAKASEW